MDTEPLTLTTGDGLRLEAELRVPDHDGHHDLWAAAVLAHPHPMHGGNMRSIVPGALFDALPAEGVACVRFNFRGVGGSEGTFGEGRAERNDIVAAIDALADITEGLPLLLAGWSFGADTALAVADRRVSGWCCVAPPLRYGKLDEMAAAHDARPKLLVIPQHDQFRDPTSAAAVTADWAETRIEVVPGADHFLVGRVDRVPPLAIEFLRSLAEPARAESS
jgi:alpha/beta superfamily hydrolase